MMMLRIILHAFFIIFLVGQVNAQKSSDNSLGTKSNSKEFNLSVFTGWSLGGPMDDIEANMSSSGLGDTSNFLGFLADHPWTKKYGIFDIEASYYLTQKSGISLNFGLINNIEVIGFEAGISNHMSLKSEIRTLSLNYAYRSKNKRHTVFIGPTYFIHKVSNGGSSRYQTWSSNNYEKLGTYIGYSFQILQKKHWFIALKTNYRWAPKSEIGPFVDIRKIGILNPTPTILTSEFSSTKVNLSCLNIGLSVGVRIHKN